MPFSLSTVKLSKLIELVRVWGIGVVGRPSAFSDTMTPYILQNVIIQPLVPGFLRDEAFKMSPIKCSSNRKQDFMTLQLQDQWFYAPYPLR